jgi:sugar phosphate isomerase/epimerase
MTRRNFLQLPTAALAVPAAAAVPIRLGFDSYSIRAFKWKAIRLLGYTASQKLDTIQFSSIDDYESLDPAYLGRVKDHAARLGISIDGGIGCVCPTANQWTARHGTPEEYILKGLHTAKAVGAASMRCFLGNANDRTVNGPIEKHMERMIAVFRAVRERALATGVRIALENHSGDMQAREVRTIIEESGKDAVGSCLDTGNPMLVMEDPLVTLEVLAPYVVTTHIRDSAVFEHARGAAFQWVALGDGSVDFKRFVARYRELCPNAAMQLEIITGRPPQVLPYFEPEHWKAFKNANAAEFARFAALAKNGRPFMGTMVIAGTEKQPAHVEAALQEQQRTDLERSFEYAKRQLDVGVRWR